MAVIKRRKAKPMIWHKYTIHTTEEAEDAVSYMLYELGITSIEINDRKPVDPESNGGLFGDVVPEMPEDDHLAEISFYTYDREDGEDILVQNGVGMAAPDDREDSPELIAAVKNGLEEMRSYMDIGAGTVTERDTADEDWANNWKKHFHSFEVGDVLIAPTWESDPEKEEKAAVTLRIDPGEAFGTGAHETTKLAIQGIRKYIHAGDTVMDIGTGSGILGILALKSGAARVFGTDIDDNTLPAITENLKQNGIDGTRFQRVLGDIAADSHVQELAGDETYDLITANIIAEILEGITPVIPRFLKKGGVYITSGILTEREQMVTDAGERAGLHVLEVNRMGDWSSVIFRR